MSLKFPRLPTGVGAGAAKGARDQLPKIVVSGVITVGTAAVKTMAGGRRSRIKEVGMDLVASMRDCILSGGVGPVSYNSHLAAFVKACSTAAKTQFGTDRRQAYRDLRAEATRVGQRLQQAQVGGPDALDKAALLLDIDRLQERIDAV
jgi:hypothetical protein